MFYPGLTREMTKIAYLVDRVRLRLLTHIQKILPNANVQWNRLDEAILVDISFPLVEVVREQTYASDSGAALT